MSCSEIWKQRHRFPVGFGRAQVIAATSASPAQSVVSVSIVGILLQNLVIKVLAGVPLGRGKQAVCQFQLCGDVAFIYAEREVKMRLRLFTVSLIGFDHSQIVGPTKFAWL